MNHQIKVGVSICVPMPFVSKPNAPPGMQHITVEWMRSRMSLQMGTNIQFYDIACDGQEVGEARNIAAERATNELNSEFLFFIDSDVILPFDAMKKLMKRAREFPDYSIFTGVYCTKDPNPEPLIYMQDGTGPYWDWAMGDLVFDIASCGMGCALIRTDVFGKLEHTESNPWFLTTNRVEEGDGGLAKTVGTEDIHFCKRAREEADVKIMADTSVLCGHQDLETGIIYGLPEDSLPYKRGRWMHGHEDETQEMKAIDLGYGGESMAELHPEYKWYTLDIRDDTGADYVQDIRGLNFPNNHWDLVFSSHTLEHIGRWDQEKVWSEMYRVCKPGGKIEIWVPNLQWAARHISDGKMDKHILNVLFGAQEEHGYRREFNTHFFGYTPSIAKSLSENAGFENVTIETYQDEPRLTYNIVIRGEKAAVEEPEATAPEENGKPVNRIAGEVAEV